MVLDTLDEHAILVGSSKVQDLVRQVKEELIPGSLEERIGQAGDMAEMID